MTYWDMVLKEVLSPDSKRRISLTNVADIKNKKNKFTTKPVKKSTKKRRKYMCRLGSKFPEVYFTRREAQCMWHLMQGKTIKAAADTLKLSSRTIEFYLKNMKKKVGCKTKPELIEQILQTDFVCSYTECCAEETQAEK